MLPPTSRDRIIHLHEEAIKRWGGRNGIREDGCLERSLGGAETAEYYAGKGDGTFGLCYAAALLYYLARNSCFVDGNKRAALLSTLDILLSYGLTLDVSNDELRDYCLTVAQGRVSGFQEVAVWLAAKVILASEDEVFARFSREKVNGV
jgi:death-on-curing protein